MKIKVGTLFIAKDKLGNQYTYRLDSIKPFDTSRKFILANLTNDTETRVEAEWFRQRQIKVIG